MEFFPVFLRLQSLPVLIIGGGRVALRKARRLSAAGARLTVIAPEILSDLAALPGITTCLRPATESDIHSDWRLVILATNSSSTQTALSRRCHELNIWYNRCDQAEDSPVVTGSLAIAEPFLGAVISSGSPGMARLARQRLEQALEPALCDLAATLNRLRERIRRTFPCPEDRQAFHARWENEPTIEKVRQVGIQKVSEEIEQCLCS